MNNTIHRIFKTFFPILKPQPRFDTCWISTSVTLVTIVVVKYHQIKFQLQTYLLAIQSWLAKWRMEASGSKSTRITFTTRRGTCPPVHINNVQLPQTETVKYLGLNLDRRLTGINTSSPNGNTRFCPRQNVLVTRVELLLDLTFRRLVRHDCCPLLSHRNYTLQEYKLFTMIYIYIHCWIL
jgi:hypothetical protein